MLQTKATCKTELWNKTEQKGKDRRTESKTTDKLLPPLQFVLYLSLIIMWFQVASVKHKKIC